MEIRLGILEEKESSQFQLRDTITVAEYKDLKKCIIDISHYSQSIQLLELVLLNERDVHDFIVRIISELEEKSVKWNAVSFEDMARFRLEANRFLLNYLSSFKTFLEHSETILKRKFGTKSKEVVDYKSFQSKAYDNSFSYRFFYKLRNYAQHCGIPLNFNHSLNASAEIKIKILLYFNRDELLKEYDSWGVIKNDISKLSERIDFFPHFNETTNNLVDIAEKFKTLMTQEIIKSAQYVQAKTQHLRTKDNKVAIFSEIETNNKGHLKSMVIEYFPYYIIDKILAQ